MKRVHIVLIAVILSVSLSTTAQISIKFRGSSGWCVGDRYDQTFVSSNQESTVGQVMSIDTITPMQNMSTGIFLLLKTERDEDISVHLGPSWYILNQDISLSVNDKNIEVRGFRTMIAGKPVIMASYLIKKDKILLLRDEDGVPYWCSWRPRIR